MREIRRDVAARTVRGVGIPEAASPPTGYDRELIKEITPVVHPHDRSAIGREHVDGARATCGVPAIAIAEVAPDPQRYGSDAQQQRQQRQGVEEAAAHGRHSTRRVDARSGAAGTGWPRERAESARTSSSLFG